MRNLLSRYRRRAGQLPARWRERKPWRAAVGAVTLVLPVVVVASSAASAGVNLVVNAGAETIGTGGGAVCWAGYGSGNNTYSFAVTSKAHSGTHAIQTRISKWSSGGRAAVMAQNPSCAPWVIPGHQYDLGVWYMSSTPDVVISVYRHDVSHGWQFWMDLKNLPATGTYKHAAVRTPVVPPHTDQISWGATLYHPGTLITDDYATVDSTVQASGSVCTAGAACTKGVWQVMPFPSPVRAIHAVLLYTGNVLLVAGSGNDPNNFAAGTFMSAVYNPGKGTFQVIPTPDDFFCAGHVQLSNGKVLIMGGTLNYPANGIGYTGQDTSYVFNPATNSYQRVNNLNDGHWYPSATELGNGDVISFGGLGKDGNGSDITEYFKYDPSTGLGTWLNQTQINQNYDYWGTYPDMILMQDGELFYSGSHVFGDNISSGADIYDIRQILNPAGNDPVTEVPGLQDTPGGPAGTDMTDQSMAVLLPPAQSQRVLLMGGGNINHTVPATRLTDLISLFPKTGSPKYTPGPLLPTGTALINGKLQAETSTEGKMYVSAVILPNGMVFETGGGLIDRADPVFEASMYNPATNTFTPGMATDPVQRTYHSSAFLLPDGRVMSIGNNPGSGGFDMHISVYSPPYLFHGARPQITSLATSQWGYGQTEQITVNQSVVSAELIRPAAVTHSSDPDQRYVALPMTVSGSHIGLNVTNNPNIAPPGWYMLFVTNASGVPSVAKWVHLG
jgi:Galactose oxidase-like, Early set domain